MQWNNRIFFLHFRIFIFIFIFIWKLRANKLRVSNSWTPNTICLLDFIIILYYCLHTYCKTLSVFSVVWHCIMHCLPYACRFLFRSFSIVHVVVIVCHSAHEHTYISRRKVDKRGFLTLNAPLTHVMKNVQIFVCIIITYFSIHFRSSFLYRRLFVSFFFLCLISFCIRTLTDFVVGFPFKFRWLPQRPTNQHHLDKNENNNNNLTVYLLVLCCLYSFIGHCSLLPLIKRQRRIKRNLIFKWKFYFLILSSKYLYSYQIDYRYSSTINGPTTHWWADQNPFQLFSCLLTLLTLSVLIIHK